MTVEKWNHKSKEYEPYTLNDEWYTPLYCEDMEIIVNCAHCGKEIEFGKCFTSREIHNAFGLGYPVCSDCYEEEWRREKGNDQ